MSWVYRGCTKMSWVNRGCTKMSWVYRGCTKMSWVYRGCTKMSWVYRGCTKMSWVYHVVDLNYPSRGKRHPQRWYVPPVDMRYDQEHMPAEWDAWLRNRRPEPPGESELRENLTIATMKKQNADKLEEKYIKKPDSTTKESAKPSYPVYDDYETTPGEGIKQN
ncbi:putative NADH dehydrogenase [ubiquinone] 1 alpha subcomplex assembly factor 2-like [Homarus americanus]|uniref:Putative NADH dehydrogenase [ubiquinone] 1 alpha subcomplex assembly factor 2-like n=1 Tax=Homarus americanus TaxID=6706 RepID=A0A8J5MWY4_HOMAM|nr:putative NADH dehydrogenase [ubiquinone] 1 alpha subcomplex assembly factor 2-like [Homarus americanus]